MMKRIAFIAHGLGIGGAQRVAALLANELVKDNYDVNYIVTRSEERVYRLDEKVKLVCKVPGKSIFQPIAKNIITYIEVKRYKPDIIISFLTNEMILCGFFNRSFIVYSLRNDPNNDMNGFLRKRVRNWLYKKADAIVFQTDGAKEYFSKDIQDKGYVIENPLTEHLPFWDNENHNKTIITACRLDNQKNVQLLLLSFGVFQQTHSKYKLQICGKGPLERELKELCKRIGLSERVNFLGFRTDVHDLMSKAEMFVLSSNYEGISNSMLEALAIGIPTICTNTPPGGAAQYIVNNDNGILIPVGNQDALVEAMCKIADDKKFRDKISMNSRSIRNHLSVNKIYHQWKKVLNGERIDVNKN